MGYLRKIDTGECFAYSEHLMRRGDMVPWTGPLPWEKKAEAPKAAAIPLPPPEEEKAPEKIEEKQDEFKCEICGRVAKNLIGLKSHLRTHK